MAVNLELVQSISDQAAAMSFNYICTGRSNKAIETLAQIKKVNPDHVPTNTLMELLVVGSTSDKYFCHLMFGDWWNGESLEGKSIEVFCDQGMGDTLNCLRYIKQMKDKWKCHIILNCFAFHKEMHRFMALIDCVDDFRKDHVRCDYCTNILSIPALMNDLRYNPNYPAHWQDLLDSEAPPSPVVQGIPEFKGCDDGFLIGCAWQSNLDNPIGQKKSIDIAELCILEDGINQLWSLIPNGQRCNMIVQPEINDLLDTASIIQEMDVVVSVDTVTLHLAGLMGKKTLGLLAYEADARWGLEDKTVWYPSVELFRQSGGPSWEPAIRRVKERLESLRALI